LQVVRPFFEPHGIPFVQQPLVLDEHTPLSVKNGSGSDENQGTANSSEGFTSFFTTTNNNSSASANSLSQSLDDNTVTVHVKPSGDEFQAPSARLQLQVTTTPRNNNNTAAGSVENNPSLAVVMASPGPRLPSRAEEESSGGGTSSSSSGANVKRVQIQQQAQEQNDNRGATGGGALAQQQQQLHAPRAETSSSSSSSGRGDLAQQDHQARHFGVPPRIVTDVSSSNRTDSAISNTNTSGSGSAENSNQDQGSSGSGNDKGSSEDLVKDDNSGEGSDSQKKKIALLGVDNIVHRHEAIVPEQPLHHQAATDELGMKGTAGAPRERKLIVKKRKRIEMRREYEAQQQSEASSESSHTQGDHLLRPGKAVSMDEVLFFSKIRR
jgi:hypothetical protein